MEREVCAGGWPGVVRLRKLSWNSNNVGSRYVLQSYAAISAFRTVFAVRRRKQLGEALCFLKNVSPDFAL